MALDFSLCVIPVLAGMLAHSLSLYVFVSTSFLVVALPLLLGTLLSSVSLLVLFDAMRCREAELPLFILLGLPLPRFLKALEKCPHLLLELA